MQNNKNKQGRKWNIYRIRCKNYENIGSTDKVRNGRPACKEKQLSFPSTSPEVLKYCKESTTVLSKKYCNPPQEVLKR